MDFWNIMKHNLVLLILYSEIIFQRKKKKISRV